jgi:hypothetical protein
VQELLVHGNDLIAATQGRAIWVLDDVAPLRELGTGEARGAVHMFAPAPAYRVRRSQNKDTPPPADTVLGRNPPHGALIDYMLAQPAKRITLEIRDGTGQALRHFDSDAAPAEHPEAYFSDAWLKPAPRLSTKAGAHRFVWDLRLSRPKAVQYNYSIGAVLGDATPMLPEGALVLPGDYQVVLVVDGRESRQTLTVLPDPRVRASHADLEQALQVWRATEAELARAWLGYGEVDAVHRQIDVLAKKTGPKAESSLADALASFAKQLAPLREGKREDAPDLGAISEVLSSLATDIEGADRAPTLAQRQVLDAAREHLDRALDRWAMLRDRELAALDARLKQAGLPPLRVPKADQIRIDEPAESEDLP